MNNAQQIGQLVGQLLADNLGNRITVPLADGIVLHVIRAIETINAAEAERLPGAPGGNDEADGVRP